MTTNGHGDQSYEERNNRPDNYGEQLFVDYCRLEGYKLHRIGFDEKQDKVQGFYNLNKIIRQLPDYVCLSPASGRMEVVSVKGTNKFKEEDYNNLTWLESVYASPKAPLRFVFAIHWNIERFKVGPDYWVFEYFCLSQKSKWMLGKNGGQEKDV
jgi:hypothetical protein